MRIGQWCRRAGAGKWHLVESQIVDRIVTRCGRQMAQPSPRGELGFADAPTWSGDACLKCTTSSVATSLERQTLNTRSDAP